MENGYIIKQGERWYARFYNPITRELENLGSGTYEQALDLYSMKQISFYLEHKYLLPKSIFIDRNMFKVGFNVKRKYGSHTHKHVYVGLYKTLELALKAREEIILSIIQ